MRAKKTIISVTLDGDVVSRLDDVADAQGLSRSAQVERFIRQGLEDSELAIKAFADPVLLQAFARAFADRDVFKRMAAAIATDTDPAQLLLFQQAMQQISEKMSEKAAAVVKPKPKRGVRRVKGK